MIMNLSRLVKEINSYRFVKKVCTYVRYKNFIVQAKMKMKMM